MKRFLVVMTMALCITTLWAQDASPLMTYVDTDGFTQEITEYDGSAPFTATFTSNISDDEGYTPLYEWRFTRTGETSPFLIRYDANTEYTFLESGTYTIQLLITFTQGDDKIEYIQETPFTVNIRESRLEFPNAFTPNGDGINDVFKAKDGWQSLISFHARVFSRSGRLIYEWHDPAGGWDGRSGGHVVPDGAYYLHVEAQGADGRHFNIRKTINVLTGYREESN